MDRQVARKQLCLISNDDVEQMGLQTYILVVKGVETIQAARTSVAINPPPTHHDPQCSLQEEHYCTRAWQDFWITTILLILLAPDQSKPLQSLIDFLRKADIRNLRDSCKMLTLSHFKQTDVLKIETTVKERVSTAIWDLHQKGLS